MRIVLANQWYPPESGWGGVGMYNYAVSRAYAELGHQVTVVASRLATNIPAAHNANGVAVRRILVQDNYRLRRLPLLGRCVRPFQQLRYARQVAQMLRALHAAQPIDVVEFADVNAEGFFFARQPCAPFVVRCQTPAFVLKNYYLPAEMPYDTRVISWCERETIRRAHALTAPSQDMANVIAADLKMDAARFVVIPNALPQEFSSFEFRFSIDPPTLRPPDTLTILHVGRLERAKGVVTLAHAIPQVVAAIPHARFVFAGHDRPTGNGGSQRAELETFLAQQGVAHAVEFTGGIDQAELLEWYTRADICVVPSQLYESFSYTAAQAMAAGKPVVASRIGGIPETVDDGETGMLCEPGNPREFADALIRLTSDAGLRERMGRAGRAKVAREFSPRRVAECNLQVYAAVRARFLGAAT